MEAWLLFLVLGYTSCTLDEGAAALAAFEAEQALEELECAREKGPYEHEDHVRLYEQLGIAYTYLERKEDALEAFDMLLTLDPGYAISYTLSPKVTFLFEKARKRSRSRPAPQISLSWPRDLEVDDPVPLDVEVVADPRGLLERAEVFVRLKGDGSFEVKSLELAPVGEYRQLMLPAVTDEPARPEVLQLYLVAYDEEGNQVLRVGDEERPREIGLGYDEPPPWYRRWWVWTIVGGVVAVGTGLGVYFGTREPPDTVGGTFR